MSRLVLSVENPFSLMVLGITKTGETGLLEGNALTSR